MKYDWGASGKLLALSAVVALLVRPGTGVAASKGDRSHEPTVPGQADSPR